MTAANVKGSGLEDLLVWVLDQIDDDERVARASKDSFWYNDGHSDEAYAFMERFNEDRVLALTAALRAIIDGFSWGAQETRAVLILTEALYGDRDGYRDEWRP